MNENIYQQLDIIMDIYISLVHSEQLIQKQKSLRLDTKSLILF